MRAFLPVTAARRGLLAMLLCLCGAAVVRAQTAPGTSIVDYIEQLRSSGINVIYSDALLTSDMRMLEVPPAGGPLDRLRSALGPYGLSLAPGPRGSWLVVRLPPAAEPSVPPPGRTPFVPAPPELEHIVVTASRYALGRSAAPSTQQLERSQLEALPTLGDDALRAIQALPGVTSSGLSARFNVRGGEADEALLLLDGVRLYNPYHLRDFQGLFSSISPRVLDTVEMRTGGYPAEYGDRMSAVVDLHSVVPVERRHHEIELSTLSASALTSGRFSSDRGAWLASVRRGTLDLVADALESDIGTPQYSDFFGKLGYAFSPDWHLTAGALVLNDKISLNDDPYASAYADYDDRYAWLRMDHTPRQGYAASYWLIQSRIGGSRSGTIDDPSQSIGTLSDQRKFVVDALKADWTYEFSERHMLRWGAELEDASMHYDVALAAEFPAPITVGGSTRTGTEADIDLDLTGRQRAAYVAYRTRPHERLTTEFGLRWDAQSYLDAAQTSPRVHLLLDVGERSTARLSWGRYFQAQGLDELQAADGVTEFFPVQQAEHLVFGFERPLIGNVWLRAELYRKEFEALRPRFENLYLRVDLLPELLPDRSVIAPSEGEARGLELTVDGGQAAWTWWATLAGAEVRDRLPDAWRPRGWEEKWSIKAGFAWAGPRWTVNVVGTAHAGWPITALRLEDQALQAGPLNAERVEDFASLDVKATRRVLLAHSDFSWFVEVTNLLNRANPCCLDYTLDFDTDGQPVTLHTEQTNWLPLVPSLGFLFEF